MLREDNSGFINFPINNPFISKFDTGNTFVYIVAFDNSDLTNQPYELSKVYLSMPGTFVSDDINQRPKLKEMQNMSIDDLIEDQIKNNQYDSVYFPNFSGKASLNKILSIPMTSCICIGWSEYTYELKNSIGFWNATFRDLTNEGRKMYYGLKKLHNNKEIRILTFSNI